MLSTGAGVRWSSRPSEPRAGQSYRTKRARNGETTLGGRDRGGTAQVMNTFRNIYNLFSFLTLWFLVVYSVSFLV